MKIVGIAVCVPLVMALIAMIIAGFQMPDDPTGRGTPGDGFLIILWVLGSLVVSVPLSAALAWKVGGRRAPSSSNEAIGPKGIGSKS